MRVLHVIGPLSTGGAQTQLLGLVRAARGRQWDATVVATSGGSLVPEFEALGCPVTVLRRIASPGLGRMWRLRRIVRRGNFDVIHGNLWQSNVYCRLAVLGLRRRPAVVISERNVESARHPAKRWLDARLAGLTDAYVGNTSAVTDFIAEVHPVTDQPVLMIPNAVDRAIFRPSDEIRREPGPVRVGSVGRLDLEKGFDVLIEATRRLIDAGRDVEVSIVGEGPRRHDLERQALGLPVSLLGTRAPGSGVAEFLRSLDVFCLPSTFREGRPNAILEALACGLPVVTTDIAGLDELFDGPTLVPPGDPEALAAAIDDAARDPEGWTRRSRPTPVKGFDDLARSYLEVFEAAIARANRVDAR